MNTNEARNKVHSCVRETFSQVVEEGQIDAIYAFGSLFDDNGEQFDIARGSDVDLILRITPRTADAEQRVNICTRVAAAVPDLEVNLMRIFKTDGTRPIASIIPTTHFEIEEGIHKGSDQVIFRSPVFYEILSHARSPVALCEHHDAHFFHTNNELIQIIQAAQSLRNQYVKARANGEPQLLPWRGPDPLPKDLMRHGALLSFAVGESKQSQRTDINVGLNFIASLVYAERNRSQEFTSLNNWLTAASGGRGDASALSREHQLLLREMLFDKAVLHVVPSFEKRMSAAISGIDKADD